MHLEYSHSLRVQEVTSRVDRGRESAQGPHAGAPTGHQEVVAAPVHAPVTLILVTNLSHVTRDLSLDDYAGLWATNAIVSSV